MRPIKVSYTPAAASLTGFLSNATGATWTLTATSASDNMAHLVTIRNDSATDHDAKTAILTGTDADGKDQTETVSLPAGSATVTSTKYFLTLTSVVPSATIGSDTMDIGWSAVSISKTIPIEWRSNASAAMTADISGTINFDIQETYANIYDSYPSTLPWVDISALASKTADTSSTATLGSTAVRILINSITAGATISLYISQPSGYIM